MAGDAGIKLGSDQSQVSGRAGDWGETGMRSGVREGPLSAENGSPEEKG